MKCHQVFPETLVPVTLYAVFRLWFWGRTGNHEVNVCFWYRRVIWSIDSETVGELRAVNASWRRLKACAGATSDPYSIQPTTSSQQRSFKPPHTVCLPCTYWAWKITASSYIRAFVTMYHVLDAYVRTYVLVRLTDDRYQKVPYAARKIFLVVCCILILVLSFYLL